MSLPGMVIAGGGVDDLLLLLLRVRAISQYAACVSITKSEEKIINYFHKIKHKCTTTKKLDDAQKATFEKHRDFDPSLHLSNQDQTTPKKTVVVDDVFTFSQYCRPTTCSTQHLQHEHERYEFTQVLIVLSRVMKKCCVRASMLARRQSMVSQRASNQPFTCMTLMLELFLLGAPRMLFYLRCIYRSISWTTRENEALRRKKKGCTRKVTA